MGKIIGIIGGMGPMATLDLYGKIISHTNAHCDQDYPHVIIDSNTQIPDRTAYILGDGENPTHELRRSAQNLVASGAQVIILACNTAHYFYDEILDAINHTNHSSDLIFINMIEETAKEIQKQGFQSIMLLATEGTYQTKIYQDVFSTFGIEIVKPNNEIQSRIMAMIYDYKSGLRNFDSNFLKSIIDDAYLHHHGPVVLGCTELPLIFKSCHLEKQIIDPTDILAITALKYI